MTSINGNGNITRWNPTKEQISILEGLYGQGMRTPTADQIQIITSRLRAYGHIEGKNVFYWFQNHKARQRQKEKELRQQSCLSFSYLDSRCLYFNNRNAAAPSLLYRPTTPSPSSIDVFRPYYEPQNEMAANNCSPYPKVVLPWVSDRRLRVADDESNPSEKAMTTTTTTSTPFGRHHMVVTTATAALEGSEKSTLDLFPVLPTGIDQHDQRMIAPANKDYNTGKRGGERPFFDFFSANRCCGQD